MNCPRCNAFNEDTMNFCTKCGANLKSPNPNAGDTNNYYQQQTNNPPPYQQQTNFQPPYQQPPQGSGPYYPPQQSGSAPYYPPPHQGYPYQPIYGGTVQRPTGIVLISLYEIIFGLFLMFIGSSILLLTDEFLTELNTTAGVEYTRSIAQMMGVILLAMGLIGLLAGILFYLWKYIGYIMSLIFLIVSGILFFSLYLIPLIIMIASLYYMFKNPNFKNAFNYMRYQRN